jgi:hypothetical protein
LQRGRNPKGGRTNAATCTPCAQPQKLFAHRCFVENNTGVLAVSLNNCSANPRWAYYILPIFATLFTPMNMEIMPGTLLKNIDSPADLKKLSREQLHQVCDELRQYIIDVVSVHGGHFGASLGVVELSVALHYVYNTPYDQLVWDVGHQAYGHKILTGRRDVFPTNRKYNGLSGFPKRSESEYDLALDIRLLPYRPHWVWHWQPNTRVKTAKA